MTLKEIAKDYEAAAVPLRKRLRELRQALNATDDPEESFRLKRRIAELTPMLTECNKLAKLCKHYYDRGFYRDGTYCLNEGRFQKHTNTLGSEDINVSKLVQKRGDLYSN